MSDNCVAAALCLVLIPCASCSADQPDAPLTGQDASAVIDTCPVSDSVTELLFYEEPPFYDEYPFRRVLSVTDQDIVDGYPGGFRWKPRVFASSEKSKVQLGFFMQKPWRVKDLTGSTVVFEKSITRLTCEDNRGHGALQIGETLRSESGDLLLFNAPNAPLSPDGRVLFPSTMSPEFKSATWSRIPCSAANGASLRTTVVFSLTLANGDAVRARIGERVPFTIGDRQYVFAAGTAHPQPGVCEKGGFAVYEEGFLFRAEAEPE